MLYSSKRFFIVNFHINNISCFQIYKKSYSSLTPQGLLGAYQMSSSITVLHKSNTYELEAITKIIAQQLKLLKIQYQIPSFYVSVCLLCISLQNLGLRSF